jgi:hypothetical protein
VPIETSEDAEGTVFHSISPPVLAICTAMQIERQVGRGSLEAMSELGRLALITFPNPTM